MLSDLINSHVGISKPFLIYEARCSFISKEFGSQPGWLPKVGFQRSPRVHLVEFLTSTRMLRAVEDLPIDYHVKQTTTTRSETTYLASGGEAANSSYRYVSLKTICHCRIAALFTPNSFPTSMSNRSQVNCKEDRNCQPLR